jgi:Uma2 family endonuclease
MGAFSDGLARVREWISSRGGCLMIEDRFYTQEEYYGLIQDEEAHIEYEEGRIIQMSPISEAHADIFRNLLNLFSFLLRGKEIAVRAEPYGLKLPSNKNYLPDIQVLRKTDKKYDYFYEEIPELVVEILSKTSVRRDKKEKKDAYEKSGIPEYWIVDPIYQNIDVCILEENKYSVYSFVEDDVINAGFFKDYGLSLSRIFSAGDIFEGLI